MKTFVLILMLSFSFQIFAQRADSIGFLSNIKGKGICIRNGSEANLKIPFYFLTGDRIKMVAGSAVVVLFNEDEVKVATGDSYTFNDYGSDKKRNKELLMYEHTKQSNSSYKMRNLGISKNSVFPKKSKIIDPVNAVIRIKTKTNENPKYFFTLKEQEKNKKIFELLNSDTTSINLQLAPLKPGHKYTWKIKFLEFDSFGEFTVLSEKQTKEFTKFDLISRASYVMSFNYYCINECFFEAYKLIEDAIKAYPEDEYFEYLKNSLF